MDILVIGGGRYFGIDTIRVLQKAGHNITLATRGLSSKPFVDKFLWLQLDVLDYDSVRSALKNRHFDVVINKIGYGSFEVKAILDSVSCDRFIHTSTAGIYEKKHFDITENDFDASTPPYIMCKRGELPYDDVKRNAERILAQKYTDLDWCSVRFPYVLGFDDYTKRLYFYVEHIMRQQHINITNLDTKFSIIHQNTAGDFMAFLVDKKNVGAINACDDGTVSVRDIVEYVEFKTGIKAMISENGENAPFNDTMESYSLSTQKAKNLGFTFSDANKILYSIIDYYISQINKSL